MNRLKSACISSIRRLACVSLLHGIKSVIVVAQDDNIRGVDSLAIEQVARNVLSHNDRVSSMRLMESAANYNIGPNGAWDDPMLMLGIQNLPTSFKFNEDEMKMNIYRGRPGANQIEHQLSQTLVDAGRYTIKPDQWK